MPFLLNFKDSKQYEAAAKDVVGPNDDIDVENDGLVQRLMKIMAIRMPSVQTLVNSPDTIPEA